MPQFPSDMFDEPPADLQRVGAHRSPARGGRGWVTFAWAALAAGVLSGIGIVYVSATSDHPYFTLFPHSTATTAAPAPTKTYNVVPDPRVLPASRDASVTVLNGTADSKGSTEVAHELRAAHWKVVSTVDAGSDDVPTTVIYYRRVADIGLAMGVAQVLGLDETQVSYSETGGFSAAIAVVVGTDYGTSTASGSATPTG